MLKIKTSDFVRDTILFGIAIVLMLTANLMTVFGGSSWETAVDVLFFAIIMMNIAIFSSLIAHIRRDLTLLIFAVSYNVLLLGRVYVSWFGYHHKLLLLLEADDFPKLFQPFRLSRCRFCSFMRLTVPRDPFFTEGKQFYRKKG